MTHKVSQLFLVISYFSFLLCLAVSFVLAEAEMKPSGLAVEYLDVPETCEKRAKFGQQLTMHFTTI